MRRGPLTAARDSRDAKKKEFRSRIPTDLQTAPVASLSARATARANYLGRTRRARAPVGATWVCRGQRSVGRVGARAISTVGHPGNAPGNDIGSRARQGTLAPGAPRARRSRARAGKRHGCRHSRKRPDGGKRKRARTLPSFCRPSRKSLCSSSVHGTPGCGEVEYPVSARVSGDTAVALARSVAFRARASRGKWVRRSGAKKLTHPSSSRAWARRRSRTCARPARARAWARCSPRAASPRRTASCACPRSRRRRARRGRTPWRVREAFARRFARNRTRREDEATRARATRHAGERCVWVRDGSEPVVRGAATVPIRRSARAGVASVRCQQHSNRCAARRSTIILPYRQVIPPKEKCAPLAKSISGPIFPTPESRSILCATV